MKKLLLVLALCAATAGAVHAATKLTYVDLVRRLVDLEALAALPVEGEQCMQWSSYDRASRYDAQTGKYVAWEANNDGYDIIRAEGDFQVLAEIEGPGCIWRIWSAMAESGHVRIYLDGAAEPAVGLPFSGYFDCKNEPFIYPSLVYISSRGDNCYVPIPFRKSCKIAADKGWGRYYHFTYSKFPKGTIVPTFKRQLSAEEKVALEAVDKFFSSSLGTDPAGRRKGELTVVRGLRVQPGRTGFVARLTGKRAITGIRVKADQASLQDVTAALRSAALRITWDGEKDPAVWVPLGDFFGTGPGANNYKLLPAGMTDEGFYSYWYMPFVRKALVELVNDGKETLPVEFSITHAPLSRPVAELGRFHAKWHRDAFPPAEPERWIDWTMLKTEGRGRFCGVMLEVWNPERGWWGEGDEKFFVNGEKFPSTIGTGSEDYFGYAWCHPDLFQKAYHSQTRNDGKNVGHVSVNRWHVGDNVPFRQSFEGAIEKYRDNDVPTLYACTVYWYLAPGGIDPYKPVPADQRFFYVEK